LSVYRGFLKNSEGWKIQRESLNNGYLAVNTGIVKHLPRVPEKL
jgi:hypothetical protein